MKNNNRIFLILTVLFFALIVSLTIGFAFTDKILDISGNVTVYKNGKVEILSVTVDNSETNTLPENSGRGLILTDSGSLALDYSFSISKTEVTYYATYLVEIQNNSISDCAFTGFYFQPVVNISGATSSQAGASVTYEYVDTPNSNLSLTDNIIKRGETRYLAVKFNIHVASQKSNTTIGVTGDAELDFSEDDSGQFLGSVLNESVDLKNNSIDCFDIKILNTYKTAKGFSVSSGNINFKVVDSSGNPLNDFSIGAASEDNPEQNEQTYNICLKAVDGAVFITENETLSIIVNPTSDLRPIIIGNLDALVQQSEESDYDPVHIGNVSLQKSKYDNGSLLLNASWTNEDTGFQSSIDKYYIRLYQVSGSTTSMLKEFTVDGAATISNYTLTLDSEFLSKNGDNMNNSNNSYYIRVYGKDKAGNIATSYEGVDYCASASNDLCLASNSISLDYAYTLTVTSSNSRVQINGNSTTATIYYKSPVSLTLKTTSDNYNLVSTITVTSGEETWSSGTEYTFGLNPGSSNTGTLTINAAYVTGNISVSASSNISTCLVEGTKIRLADGSTKNIEDIKYDDLIIALSHDTGEIVYEYPIWIEKKGQSDEYQITTFSDGSVLKTVSSHGVFSIDANKYVSVTDRDNFHVGTRVLKVAENNNLVPVSVTNIETINDTVNYYHVSSTYYHNVVADNILTTDALLVVSNMFTFDPDYTWSQEREDFINRGNLFRYEDWSWKFPSHIFKGFRMSEAMILYEKGLLDISLFDRVLNGKISEPPKNENGKYLWMVTTSDNINNDESKFYEEGSYYTLPVPKNVDGKEFNGWYNYADSKIYMPGDKVEIIYGMYFKALWK